MVWCITNQQLYTLQQLCGCIIVLNSTSNQLTRQKSNLRISHIKISYRMHSASIQQVEYNVLTYNPIKQINDATIIFCVKLIIIFCTQIPTGHNTSVISSPSSNTSIIALRIIQLLLTVVNVFYLKQTSCERSQQNKLVSFITCLYIGQLNYWVSCFLIVTFCVKNVFVRTTYLLEYVLYLLN